MSLGEAAARCAQLWLIVAPISVTRGGVGFSSVGSRRGWCKRAGFTVAQMGVFASFPFVMGLIGDLRRRSG